MESLRTIKKLLGENVRDNYGYFNYPLEWAMKNKHPKLKLVEQLRKVIIDEENISTLKKLKDGVKLKRNPRSFFLFPLYNSSYGFL